MSEKRTESEGYVEEALIEILNWVEAFKSQTKLTSGLRILNTMEGISAPVSRYPHRSSVRAVGVR
jgi:hypothetical protein